MASNPFNNFPNKNITTNSSPSSSNPEISSSNLSHSRAIDRYSPHLRDPLREKYLSCKFPNRAKTGKEISRKNTEKMNQLMSPATSSRFLLKDLNRDDFSVEEILPPVISVDEFRFEYLKAQDFVLMDSPLSPVRQLDQVVVLKVSLHCKGCEGKVRKHISKMKGVTSFTTDLATKKVTVIGDLTPLSVLNSVSKVKKAQFWPSP